MKAATVLPAPDGLTDDLMGQAIYELNKLGTIMPHPLQADREGAVEVSRIPDEMKPKGAPKELPFLRYDPLYMRQTVHKLLDRLVDELQAKGVM